MKFLVASLTAHAIAIALLLAWKGRSPAPPALMSTPITVVPIGPPPDDPVGSADSLASESGTPARAPARAPARFRARSGSDSADPFAISGVSVSSGTDSDTGSGSGSGSGAGPEPESAIAVAAPVRTRPTPDASAIHAAVQRRLRYPRLARERGIEGTVLVRFAVRPDGSVGDLTILPPADPLLAEAAREAVLGAAPFASPAGTIRLPVEFSLDAPP